MKIETRGNIFDEKADAVCVTTNGVVGSTGAVMGKGIAKEADNRYHLKAILGKQLQLYGNHVFDMGVYDGKHVVTFPTKKSLALRVRNTPYRTVLPRAYKACQ